MLPVLQGKRRDKLQQRLALCKRKLQEILHDLNVQKQLETVNEPGTIDNSALQEHLDSSHKVLSIEFMQFLQSCIIFVVHSHSRTTQHHTCCIGALEPKCTVKDRHTRPSLSSCPPRTRAALSQV